MFVSPLILGRGVVLILVLAYKPQSYKKRDQILKINITAKICFVNA